MMNKYQLNSNCRKKKKKKNVVFNSESEEKKIMSTNVDLTYACMHEIVVMHVITIQTVVFIICPPFCFDTNLLYFLLCVFG